MQLILVYYNIYIVQKKTKNYVYKNKIKSKFFVFLIKFVIVSKHFYLY